MDINNICPNCMSHLNEEDEFCSNCGYKKGAEDSTSTHALKPYTILQGKFLVGNVIGEGGFGITCQVFWRLHWTWLCVCQCP